MTYSEASTIYANSYLSYLINEAQITNSNSLGFYGAKRERKKWFQKISNTFLVIYIKKQ